MPSFPNNSLRIGVILHASSSAPCALSPICERRGHGMDTALIVCRTLHLNCTFHAVGNHLYNSSFEQSQNWTGVLMQAILDGHFDTSLPVFMPNYRRLEMLHFSQPYFYGDALLVTRAIDASRSFRGLGLTVLQAFQWPLWVAFAVSYVALAFVLNCSVVFESRKSRQGWSGLIRGHRAAWGNRHPRVIVFCFLLLEFMLLSCYTGVSYSNKMLSKFKAPYTDVDTFITCVWTRQCRLVGSASSASLTWLLSQAASSSRGGLTEALSRNPIQYVAREDILTEVLRDRTTYTSAVLPRDVFSELSSNNRDCLFYLVRIPYMDMGAFPFQKKRRYHKEFDRMARYFQEHGLSIGLERKYNLQGDTCSQSREAVGSSPSLTIRVLYGVLCFYAAGAIASALVLSCERACFRLWRGEWIRL